MENIVEIIKKLRRVEPDPLYVKRSRGIILGNVSRPICRVVAGWIFNYLQTGAAVALAGIFVFIILAGVSLWHTLSPLNVASLDLSGLKAEAQAIDIQIQLANLGYSEPALGGRPNQSTPQVVAAPRAAKPAAATAHSPATPSSTTTTPTTDQTTAASEERPLTIDEVLQKLSK